MCRMLKIIYHLTEDSIKYYTISKLDNNAYLTSGE